MNLNERGEAQGMTIGDVLRWLIRGGIPNTEYNQRRALLTIDAWEKGYPDAESYEAELAKQAEVAAPVEPAGPETDAERAARLEADNARLQAQVTAGRPSARPPVADTPVE